MGGVAGHLNHIHENLDFTFGEIKSLLSSVASADIEVFEKVDGQNVFFTWNNELSEIRTARNAGDIKKGGMSPDEYASKWAAHPNPNVSKAFMNGFNAIELALKKLDANQLQEIFGPKGQNYVNAEIMYTGNPNIIVYSGDWIVLHNMHVFLEDGTRKIETSGPFTQLVAAVESAEQELDKNTWGVSGPKLAELKDISNGSAFNDFVTALDSETGMADSATIGDYVAEKLRVGMVGSLPVATHIQEEIIKVILDIEGAKTLKDLKKSVPKSLHKDLSSLATKVNKRKVISRIVGPIEKIISDFAIEVLRGLQSFFVDDHDSEVSRMRADLESSIKKLEAAPAEDAERAAEILEKQLSKLGPIENLASTMEGVVFEHPPGSKILYKLTGTFAMANQVIGRARRMSEIDKLKSESVLREYIYSIMVG